HILYDFINTLHVILKGLGDLFGIAGYLGQLFYRPVDVILIAVHNAVDILKDPYQVRDCEYQIKKKSGSKQEKNNCDELSPGNRSVEHCLIPPPSASHGFVSVREDKAFLTSLSSVSLLVSSIWSWDWTSFSFSFSCLYR